MQFSEKITAVGAMQTYITAHLGDDITLDSLAEAAGYSKYHAARTFKELTGKTPFETIRALRLTKAAQILQKSDKKVVDVALDSGFDSHDGFTRAFARQFAITPRKYQQETPAVPWEYDYRIEAYYRMKEDSPNMENEKVSEKVLKTVTVTALERPARKLILLRAKKAAGGDYLSFCKECGCEWNGFLDSISEKMDTAGLLTLPPNLVGPGTANTAAGVEVPMSYDKPIPDGYDVVELPPCTMLYFIGAPYANENDFDTAIGIVWEAMDAYKPERFGWQYDPELAPRFNYGADAKGGARMAVPVKKI
ncbi:hypothetical protein AGMMS49992_12550 [Clostridia bacterium]|nr:hypothetical protein AGMMS49992_12550 [Clostridia bacterium]